MTDDDDTIPLPERQRPVTPCVADRVMGHERCEQFLHTLREHVALMMPSTTGREESPSRTQHRVGYVMPPGWMAELPDGWLDEFKAHVLERVPVALRMLGMEAFTLGGWEFQTALYHHRGFYKPHTDNSLSQYARRRLAFSWYCYDLPRLFSGGALTFTRGAVSVMPEWDRLVLFHPKDKHEVEPVECWSADPMSGRIALGGWIHADS